MLGIEVTEENDILRLQLGGGTPTIVYPKPDHVPATYTVLNFPVPDVEAAVDELTAQGVDLRALRGNARSRPTRRACSAAAVRSIAWFTDPAGNIFSVIAED